MLEKQHLSRSGLVSEARWRLFALLSPEWRIRKHHVELARCVLKQSAIGFVSGQRVAVPEIRLVDAVQHKVCQSNRKDEVLLFHRRRCGAFSVSICSAVAVSPSVAFMCSYDCARKPPVPRPRDRRYGLRRPRDQWPAPSRGLSLAWCEELAAVVALLAHLRSASPRTPATSVKTWVSSTLCAVISSTLSSTSRMFFSVSMRTRSTPRHNLADDLLPW